MKLDLQTNLTLVTANLIIKHLKIKAIEPQETDMLKKPLQFDNMVKKNWSSS